MLLFNCILSSSSCMRWRNVISSKRVLTCGRINSWKNNTKKGARPLLLRLSLCTRTPFSIHPSWIRVGDLEKQTTRLRRRQKSSGHCIHPANIRTYARTHVLTYVYCMQSKVRSSHSEVAEAQLRLSGHNWMSMEDTFWIVASCLLLLLFLAIPAKLRSRHLNLAGVKLLRVY